MADIILENMAHILGNYSGVPTQLDSLAITTRIVTGLTIVKSADKPVWINDVLTYTVTLSNTASLDYETPVLTDTLDILKIALVAGSVKLDGVDILYDYDSGTGALSIDLPSMLPGGSAIITFQVQKI